MKTYIYSVKRFADPLVTNSLLLLVFIILVMIWRRMPATYGEYRDADDWDERAEIRGRSVLVKIRDTVDVEIENEPITVEIQKSLFDD